MVKTYRHIPFTRVGLRKRLLADGGWLTIRLKLDEDDAKKLGQLKILCGRTTGLVPVTHLILFDRVSVQHLAFCRETLSRPSRRPRITLNIDPPFHVLDRPPTVNNMSKVKNLRISFPVSSPAFTDLGRQLSSALDDTLLRLEDRPGAKRRPQHLFPRFMLMNQIPSTDDLNRKLEFAKQNYRRGIRLVTAIGLTLQFEPVFSVDPATGLKRQIIERPPAKDFLFRNVDENVHEEGENLPGIEDSRAVESTVSKT